MHLRVLLTNAAGRTGDYAYYLYLYHSVLRSRSASWPADNDATRSPWRHRMLHRLSMQRMQACVSSGTRSRTIYSRRRGDIRTIERIADGGELGEIHFKALIRIVVYRSPIDIVPERKRYEKTRKRRTLRRRHSISHYWIILLIPINLFLSFLFLSLYQHHSICSTKQNSGKYFAPESSPTFLFSPAAFPGYNPLTLVQKTERERERERKRERERERKIYRR